MSTSSSASKHHYASEFTSLNGFGMKMLQKYGWKEYVLDFPSLTLLGETVLEKIATAEQKLLLPKSVLKTKV
jgi:hypothetical protein